MLRVKERDNIFIHVHIDWKEPKNLLFPCFVHLQQWEDGKRNHLTTHKAQNIAIKYWKWKSIWRELLLYGTHSQLHSMQSSCRVGEIKDIYDRNKLFCASWMMGPILLSWVSQDLPSQGCYLGCRVKMGCVGATFCVGSKSPRGVFFMGTSGLWGEAKCRPKYGIARSPGL